MGLIGSILNVLFGPNGNVVRNTVEVFRENKEASAVRDAKAQTAAIEAFRAEFTATHGGRFNQFMDGVNRIPRPALALSMIGLFASAMINPVWFSERMQGVALVPEPLWWLMGVVVSFYFGARHQIKGQEFQRALVTSVARIQAETPVQAPSAFWSGQTDQVIDTTDNAALADWKETQRGG